MATVTKPIALDESFNTTEQTPRNIADVLAQALQMLNTTISGLNFINCVVVQTLPTTDISTTTIYLVPKNPSQTDNLYDEYINLTGTSAGWEKIGDTEIDLSGYYTSAEVDALLADKADASDIPTVNDGTLTIQQNGETKATFTANQSGNSTVNIEIPTTDIQTAVDEFETYNGGLLPTLKVSLTPNQDLHGYSEPWVGGSRKNKLPLVLADIKSLNTSGTWNGNVYTINGGTITIDTDADGNVIGIKANGTPTVNINFVLIGKRGLDRLASGDYIMNGCPAGGATDGSTYYLGFYVPGKSRYDFGSGTTITLTGNEDTSANIFIHIHNGYTTNNLIFSPMLRDTSETDPTFEPYENICPISGHTQVKVGDDGKNKLPNAVTSKTVYGVTFTVNSDDTITANGTATNIVGVAYENIELNGTYILNGCPSGGGSGTYELQVVTTTATSRDYGDGVTFTVNGNCTVQILIRQGTTLNNAVFKPMIRLASDTDPIFVPYNGYQVTVNLGGTYYSGTLDVVTGVFTPDTASVVFDGSDDENWIILPSDPSAYFFIHVPTMTAKGWKYVLSEVFKDVYKETDARNNDCSIWSRYQQIHIHAPSSIVPSGVSNEGLAEFKAWLSNNPQKVVYELATPTPIQLSPTMVKALVGENHLSAPLEGQEITESKYKQMFTFDDVIAYIQSLS